MVANPFYAMNIDEGSRCLMSRSSAKTTGLGPNVGLIEELDPEAYLRNLLSILKGNYPRS